MDLVLLLIMYVALFNYVWISEISLTWEKPADSVFRLSHLFTMSLIVVTSFSWYIWGGVWDLFVSVPDRCPLQLMAL